MVAARDRIGPLAVDNTTEPLTLIKIIKKIQMMTVSKMMKIIKMMNSMLMIMTLKKTSDF